MDAEELEQMNRTPARRQGGYKLYRIYKTESYGYIRSKERIKYGWGFKLVIRWKIYIGVISKIKSILKTLDMGIFRICIISCIKFHCWRVHMMTLGRLKYKIGCNTYMKAVAISKLIWATFGRLCLCQNFIA